MTRISISLPERYGRVWLARGMTRGRVAGFELESALELVLACPACGYAVAETVLEDARVYIFEGPDCTASLKRLPGDCGVFFFHGSVRCPPMQREAGAGASYYPRHSC